ncbi:serine/threonine protein kinase [Actinoallomurus rhizosphaericola]|uniref:serine/threonine protein kinase n=1 Tax=Actinoallomurus rhizosphaericola TaxID=2952536 RepID=UPI00209040FA|nr:serine/threonine-protein kinase [Actinoallomurus rhizosphaericola]MCO5993511.1 serine/threonine protein kinase [Actinoallomurus rhizosphaericola]
MPSLQPLTAQDPTEVGGYRLLGRLGEGGQGVVCLGESPSGERVAVKLLRSAGDARERRYFAKELAAARKVDPFCTARILAADVEGEVPFIVSEFIDGPSLRQVVGDGDPLRGSALQRLAIGTATALVAIHQAGVVHRDFKPANVLMGPDGPRVIDFGVAYVVDATISGHITGTPAFMAPEQLRNEPPGQAADMFAWGGTIVYAATGRAPFGQDHLGAVVSRIQHAPPDLGDLEGPLREIAAICLDKDPARRPSARQALAWLLGEQPLPSSGPAPAPTVAGPTLRWAPGSPPGAAPPVTMPQAGPYGTGTGPYGPAGGPAAPQPRSGGRTALLAGAGALVVVAALVAVAVTLVPWNTGTGRARRPTPTPTPTAKNVTWFGHLGLALRPGWAVSATEDSGTHVLTQPQSCRSPRANFLDSDCAGFWIMGPDQISTGAYAQGSYHPGHMYYPNGGVVACAGLPHTMLVTPDKAVATEPRPVGSRSATYSEYTYTCREDSGAHRDVSFPSQREWYLPEQQVLIIDRDSMPELSGILQNAVWR